MHQYYLHSQYPSTEVTCTIYYRCIHRKLCSGKISVKDGNLIVKESHSCVKGESVVMDATKRMGIKYELSPWQNQLNLLSKSQQK